MKIFGPFNDTGFLLGQAAEHVKHVDLYLKVIVLKDKEPLKTSIVKRHQFEAIIPLSFLRQIINNSSMEKIKPEEYLKTYVHPILEPLVVDLLIERPNEPLEFIKEWADKKLEYQRA